jgi:hypothetical protein
MANIRPQIPEPEPRLTPVRDVFSALAEELERARSLGLRVEGAICAIAVRSSIDGSVVSELQQLDAVLQHIAALRDFASELARQSMGVGEVSTDSALERVTLGEVRVRLGGRYLDGDDPDDNWEML